MLGAFHLCLFLFHILCPLPHHFVSQYVDLLDESMLDVIGIEISVGILSQVQNRLDLLE